MTPEEVESGIVTLKRCISNINTTDKMLTVGLESHKIQIEALVRTNTEIVEELQKMDARIKKLEDWINGL